MKKLFLWFGLVLMGIAALAQVQEDKTLLWRVSGNNLTKPTYIFGTIHLLCAEDIQLSDSLNAAISNADKVYLELDMDNFFEILQVANKMKMRNDTTLSDLLTKAEYEKVKLFFREHNNGFPFSMVETFKPMLLAFTLMQPSTNCTNAVAMEQLVMKEAKKRRKEIKGLETMAYQFSIFDSIPYKIQAQQLVTFVENYGKKNEAQSEFEELTSAYKQQDLKKLEELTSKDEDMGIAGFADIILYNRNKNWVTKLNELMPGKSLVVAVGAGHLLGEKGIISLLKKAGYKVEPVENNMMKKLTQEI